MASPSLIFRVRRLLTSFITGQVTHAATLFPGETLDSSFKPVTQKKEFREVPRGISLSTATAIVVANMVGTGVFTSLGFQVIDIHTGFAVMMLWAIGGFCALCGAMAYGELASALPRSGGEYHFLSKVFHPAVGFVAGWTSVTAGFAAPVALSGMAFGQYFQAVIPGISPLLPSVAVVWCVSLIHLHSIRAGSNIQNFLTWPKVFLIALFIGAGFIFGVPQPILFTPAHGDLHTILSAPFAVSLVYVMYAFSGWNAATYIVGEVRDPERNVPRSLLLGTGIVLGLYLGLNAMFLYTTPLPELQGQLEVGVIAGRHLFGPVGARIIGALICLVLVSSISSMVWIGPRVAMTMGEDLRALHFLARKTRTGVPFAASLAQLLLTSLLLFTATFKTVLLYVQFTLILSSFLTVLGLMVFRFMNPDRAHPHRTLGYPVPPLIFLGISGFMMFYLVKSTPVESAAGLATMLLGLLVYFISPKTSQPQNNPPHRPDSPIDLIR